MIFLITKKLFRWQPLRTTQIKTIMESNHNFRVINHVRWRQNKFINESSCTYEFSFKKIDSKDFFTEVRKFDFKCRNNENTQLGKPAKIIQEYTKTLCPLLFEIKDDRIQLLNSPEILERLNTKSQVLKQQPEYFMEESEITDQHHLIDYFWKHFSGLTKENGQEMAKYYLPLDLIKLVLFCMKKSDNKVRYEFPWKINFIDYNGIWSGKKFFDPVLNISKYYGFIGESDEIIAAFTNKAILYEIPIIPKTKGSLLDSSICHETHFLGDTSDCDYSETNIKIKAGTFYEYEETFYISAINYKKTNS